MKEIDVKREFRSVWDGWSCAYEFGMGGDAGAPDLQVLVNKPRSAPLLLPIELKRGSMTMGMVEPEEVRPAQIQWHAAFRRAGGRSVLVVGVEFHDGVEFDGVEFHNGIKFFVVGAHLLPYWKVGYNVGPEACCLNPEGGNGVKRELEAWLERERKKLK